MDGVGGRGGRRRAMGVVVGGREGRRAGTYVDMGQRRKEKSRDEKVDGKAKVKVWRCQTITKLFNNAEQQPVALHSCTPMQSSTCIYSIRRCTLYNVFLFNISLSGALFRRIHPRRKHHWQRLRILIGPIPHHGMHDRVVNNAIPSRSEMQS